PIYANGIQPANLQARRTAISAWVYAPFHVRTFIESGLRQLDSGQLLRIVDLGQVGPGIEVYVDPEFRDDPEPETLRHSETVELDGRTWRLDFRSALRTAGAAGAGADLLPSVAAGLIVSFQLFAVLLTLAYSQSRTERLAEAMSESYRHTEQRFHNAVLYSAGGIALLDRQG